MPTSPARFAASRPAGAANRSSSARVTAHKLRHTFTSILFVRGEDPPTVMARSGTRTPHSRCARLRGAPRPGRRGADEDPRRVAAIGTVGHPTGRQRRRTAFPRRRPQTTKTPRLHGLQTMGAAGGALMSPIVPAPAGRMDVPYVGRSPGTSTGGTYGTPRAALMVAAEPCGRPGRGSATATHTPMAEICGDPRAERVRVRADGAVGDDPEYLRGRGAPWPPVDHAVARQAGVLQPLVGPIIRIDAPAGRRRRIVELVVAAKPERPWRPRPALGQVLVLGLPAKGRQGPQAPEAADPLDHPLRDT